MQTRIREQVAKAVTLVTPTLYDVARWLDMSYATARAYRQAVRTAPAPTIRQIAAALRRHARHVLTAADRLDTLANDTDQEARGRP